MNRQQLIQVLTIYVKAFALSATALLLLAETICDFVVAYMLEACAHCAAFLGLSDAKKGLHNLISQLHYGMEAISSQIDQIQLRAESLKAELKTIVKTQA